MSYRQKIVSTQNKYSNNHNNHGTKGVSKTRANAGGSDYNMIECTKRERRVSKGRDGSIEISSRLNASLEKSKTPINSGPVSSIFGRVGGFVGTESKSLKTSAIMPASE